MLVREHYTTGDIEHDIVGDFFKEVFDKIEDPDKVCRSEVQHFDQSDNILSLMWYNGKLKAFVIEARTDFNNIDLIKGVIDE